MQISPIGFLVFAAIALIGYLLRGPLVIPAIVSMAFGATAMVTLSSLGGSSPLIASLFSVVLISATAMHRRIWRELGSLFGEVRTMWLLLALLVYSVIGALLFPRVFAGQTTVFIVAAERAGIVESTLMPVSGNISQTMYFVLGGMTAMALCLLMLHRDRVDEVRRGFFVWAGLTTAMGLVDLLGKLSGARDLLAPVRTANYAMLTDTQVNGGFWRISGAFSEASAFAASALACMCFLYVLWRRTGSRPARNMLVVLLTLAVLCTSSTAYVGLAGLGLIVGAFTLRAIVAGRIDRADIGIVFLFGSTICIVLAISLVSEGFFDPFLELLDTMVIDKSTSTSAQERAYWNLKSLQAFVDTRGFGVALGSSRASSWPVAVISQLGLIGVVGMTLLLVVVMRGLGRHERLADPETGAVVAAVRASALGGLLAASLTAGSADPGILFFIAFAVVSVTRARLARMARPAASTDDAGGDLSGRYPGRTTDSASHATVWGPQSASVRCLGEAASHRDKLGGYGT